MNRFWFIGVLGIILCPRLQADSETHAPWFTSGPKAAPSTLKLPETIRVELLHSRHSLTLSCTDRFTYVALRRGKPVNLKPNAVLRVKGSRHELIIGKKTISEGILVAPVSPRAVITVNGRSYRGTLTLRARSSGFVDVIEQVGLEEYLYGVLPREVGVDWPADALKAQAVVSRTYVAANLGKYADRGYDITSDVYTQVYGGLDDENPAASEAVDATQGEILVDAQGAPILAFFHSSCGGRTENPAYVWEDLKDPPDYLESVRDSYCKDDPYNHWHLDISAETLRLRLRRAGYRVGTPRTISIDKRSPSGRAWVIAVAWAQGQKLIPGNKFRLAIGPDQLRSTLLSEIRRDGKMFHFEGSGWGHGVGLCQWGARGRALAGQSYAKILSAYYPRARLVHLTEQSGEEASP